jgi:hypothetical protein
VGGYGNTGTYITTENNYKCIQQGIVGKILCPLVVTAWRTAEVPVPSEKRVATVAALAAGIHSADVCSYPGGLIVVCVDTHSPAPFLHLVHQEYVQLCQVRCELL